MSFVWYSLQMKRLIDSLKHVLLILETFKDEITLLILKLFDTVVRSHVVEFANLITLDELLIAIIQIVVLFFGLGTCSSRMEHVRTQVQDRSLVNIAIFIIELLCTFLNWRLRFYVPILHIPFIQWLFAEHFDEATNLIAKMNGLRLNDIP